MYLKQTLCTAPHRGVKNSKRRAVALATLLLGTVALQVGSGISRAGAADDSMTDLHVFQPAQLAAAAGDNASLLRKVTAADAARATHEVTTSAENRFIAATSTGLIVVDFVAPNASGVSSVTDTIVPDGAVPIQLAQTRLVQVGNTYTATTTGEGETKVTHPQLAAGGCSSCADYAIGGTAATGF